MGGGYCRLQMLLNLEDTLLRRRTRAYTRKYQQAYCFSLYGNPPPPTLTPLHKVRPPKVPLAPALTSL